MFDRKPRQPSVETSKKKRAPRQRSPEEKPLVPPKVDYPAQAEDGPLPEPPPQPRKRSRTRRDRMHVL